MPVVFSVVVVCVVVVWGADVDCDVVGCDVELVSDPEDDDSDLLAHPDLSA